MENAEIYFEKQESALCGQHCLNNLTQGMFFDPFELAEIAKDLDEKERRAFLELGLSLALSLAYLPSFDVPDNCLAGHDNPDLLRFLADDSHNVDESGNFSFDTLRIAVQDRFGFA